MSNVTPTSPAVPTTILNLPAATTPLGNGDLFVVEQGGITKNVTAVQAILPGQVNSVVGVNGITTTQSAGVVTVSTSALSNNRNAQTANYTVQSTDQGKTIALGGNTFYALTLNAASTYASNFMVLVINEDSGRGKTIACNGLSSFILWPLQTAIIYNDNNTWQVSRPGRWELPAGTTLYVDNVNGLDTNDGLASGAGNALLTIEVAVNKIAATQWDLFFEAAPQVTVQLANSASSYPGIHFPGPVVGRGGNASIRIQGNSSDPTQTTITDDGTGNCINLFDNALLELQDVQIDTTTTSCISLASNSMVRLLGTVYFKRAGSGQSHMFINQGSEIFVDGVYHIRAVASYHVNLGDGGRFTCSNTTVTFDTSGAFTVYARNDGISQQNWAGTTINLQGNTITGQRFQQYANSFIATGGVNPNTFFPGDTNGTSVTGANCDYALSNATQAQNVFTYDISTASGTQTIATAGFRPKSVTFLAGINNTGSGSIGIDNGSATQGISLNLGGVKGTVGIVSGSIQLIIDGSNYATGHISSFTDTGFIITWVKTGSPTGTASIVYTAI